jgi:CheY-like chemotaxis protein
MVDDSPEDIFLVKRALDQSGKSQFFQSVPGAEQAILYLKGEGGFANRQEFPFPNLLLVDIKMPGVGGFELFTWLKNHQECKVIPAIAFSSSSLESDVRRVYALGGNAFISKPQDLGTLTELICLTYSFWSRCEVPSPPPAERCA